MDGIHGWFGKIVHWGKVKSFSTEVTIFFQTCLERQINEAARICQTQAKYILYSENKSHQASILTQVVVQ